MLIITELFVGGDLFLVANKVVAVEEHFNDSDERTGTTVVHCTGGVAFHVNEGVDDFVKELKRELQS